MKQQTILFVFITAFLSLSFGPCDETIGPSEEPQRVFETRIEGFYVLSLTDNSLKIYLTVKNVFDETLSGPAVLKGSIEIVSARDPSKRRTFEVKRVNLITSGGQIDNQGNLILDAGASMRFGVSWDFMTDDSTDLRKNFFSYVKDNTCQGRCLAFTEDFILTGSVTIFKQTGPSFAGTIPYALCFVSSYASPGDCPPIITSAPCNLRPPQNVKACFPQF